MLSAKLNYNVNSQTVPYPNGISKMLLMSDKPRYTRTQPKTPPCVKITTERNGFCFNRSKKSETRLTICGNDSPPGGGFFFQPSAAHTDMSILSHSFSSQSPKFASFSSSASIIPVYPHCAANRVHRLKGLEYTASGDRCFSFCITALLSCSNVSHNGTSVCP